MKSINTFFDGNYFRSRLEAKWAYFFKRLNVKYEYEPNGFYDEKTNESYLPDFYLPETTLRGKIKGVYIEIKPKNFTQSKIPQSKWFDKPLILFKGLPYDQIWESDEEFGYECWLDHWDNCMKFWICSSCGHTKIEFAEGNYDYCPICENECDNELLNKIAYETMFIRFEHNEKPNI